MPTQRGSADFGDLIDDHGTALVNLIEAVERVTGDGIVEPDEHQLLKVVVLRTMKSFAPLPGRAAQQDDAFRCIGAIAGAGRVSRHAASVVKQAHADLREVA